MSQPLFVLGIMGIVQYDYKMLGELVQSNVDKKKKIMGNCQLIIKG